MSTASRSDMHKALKNVLEWYQAMGVDCALSEEPQNKALHDQKTKPNLPAVLRLQPEQQAQQKIPEESEDEAIHDAQALAQQANNLDELRQIMQNFEGCPLSKTAHNLVFGDGNPQAKLLIIGEAPGSEEDMQGKPFVGRSGMLLDKMFAAIGLKRADDFYIINTIPWRPPGNRTPSVHERAICMPFLKRQIELIDPAIIITAGAVPSRALLELNQGVMSLRGKWFHFGTIPVLPMLHPAYLLRTPSAKRLAWQDMLTLKSSFALYSEPRIK